MSGGDFVDYDDIILLSHHTSASRPRMSRLGRAAQFSPFAALTGYEDIIAETSRVIGTRAELSEDRQAKINERLNMLLENISEYPEAEITFFVPDKRKEGGDCETAVGFVKRIDEYEKAVVFTDGRRILISDIYDIEGEFFERFISET